MSNRSFYSLLSALVAIGAVVLAKPQAAGASGNGHDFTFEALEGGELPLAQFRGKVVMVVNTASLCGFTPQYEGLQALYEKYRDRGFVIVGVPSNDFGGQEPGTAGEIKEFCETNFAIDFPLAAKAHVRGDDAHPFYRWAREEYGVIAAPRWNFHKYLLDGEGRLVDWFSTATEPGSHRVGSRIEEIIATLD